MLGRNDVIQQDDDPKQIYNRMAEKQNQGVAMVRSKSSLTESLQRDLNRVVHKQTPASLNEVKQHCKEEWGNIERLKSYEK